MLTIIEKVSHQKVEAKTKWECYVESAARDPLNKPKVTFLCHNIQIFPGKGLGFIDFKAQNHH